jgi:single-strand DNA-binding protein
MIAGNLVRDPEVRETGSGKSVANITLAFDPPGGGKREGNGNSGPSDAIFVEVELWERTAEIAMEYLKKGSPVLIEGRLKMDRWEDRESGKTRTKLKVAGERMKFLNPAPPRDGQRNQSREQENQRQESTGARR